MILAALAIVAVVVAGVGVYYFHRPWHNNNHGGLPPTITTVEAKASSPLTTTSSKIVSVDLELGSSNVQTDDNNNRTNDNNNTSDEAVPSDDDDLNECLTGEQHKPNDDHIDNSSENHFLVSQVDGGDGSSSSGEEENDDIYNFSIESFYKSCQFTREQISICQKDEITSVAQIAPCEPVDLEDDLNMDELSAVEVIKKARDVVEAMMKYFIKTGRCPPDLAQELKEEFDVTSVDHILFVRTFGFGWEETVEEDIFRLAEEKVVEMIELFIETGECREIEPGLRECGINFVSDMVNFSPSNFSRGMAIDEAKATELIQKAKDKHEFDYWLSTTTADFHLCSKLKNAPESLRSSKAFVLKACVKNCWAVLHVPKSLQNDVDVLSVARRQLGYDISGSESDIYQNTLSRIKKRGLELLFAPNALRCDKSIVMAACYQDYDALEFAAEPLRNDKEVILHSFRGSTIKFRFRGLALKYASPALQRDKTVVLEACLATGSALQYAAPELQQEKEVVMVACRNNGLAFQSALQFTSPELQHDKEVVMVACRGYGRALQYAAPELQHDKEVVIVACRSYGPALQYASPELQNDKEVVLEACVGRHGGIAFKFASPQLRNDIEVFLAACGQRGVIPLRDASPELQNTKRAVLEACRTSGGSALEFASPELQDDKEVALDACRRTPLAFRFVSERLKGDKWFILHMCRSADYHGFKFRHFSKFFSERILDDKDVMLVVCRSYGLFLQFTTERLRRDKDLVLMAASSNPDALKYALGGLNQDQDCLIAANLWDAVYQDTEDAISKSLSKRKIVLSTKFALSDDTYSEATRFAVLLKRHEYILNGNFVVYSPNAYAKSTCDPEWTRYSWPCRGTYETCRVEDASLKIGVPPANCCWRYSFRYQLQIAKDTNGFMIQIVECANSSGKIANRTVRDDDGHILAGPQKLGDGQMIEREMAKSLQTKSFRIFAPIISDSPAPGELGEYQHPFNMSDIDLVVDEIKKWCMEQEDGGDMRDLSECTIQLERTRQLKSKCSVSYNTNP